MNNISNIIPLVSYAALLSGMPSWANEIPEPQQLYSVEYRYISDNTVSGMPYIDTYENIIDSVENILTNFINAVVADATYWDEDVADFINEIFWDLI